MTLPKSDRERPTGRLKIAVLAVEDQCVITTSATGTAYFEDGADGARTPTFRYDQIDSPQIIQRDSAHVERLRGDGDFTSAALLQLADEFLDSFDGSLPDILGISTFGTVDTKRAFVQHVPSRGPNSLAVVKVDLRNGLRSRRLPVVVDNDATAAAFGEYLFGAGRPHQTADAHAFAYVWAGRGLNAGIVIDGSPWQGRLHPEMGHLIARRHDYDALPGGHPGNCGIHHDCLTGLAGFRTLRERMALHGQSEEEAIDALSYYLAQLCAAVTLTVAPARIVMGGLSTRQTWSAALLDRLCDHYVRLVAGFPGYDVESTARNVLIPSQLGDRASMLGMLEIARRSLLPRHSLRSGN